MERTSWGNPAGRALDSFGISPKNAPVWGSLPPTTELKHREQLDIKVVVNKNACCAYGLCAEICPEVYKLDANGIAYVEEELVPEGLEELAREGAAACPQLAIAVVEVTD